MRQTSIFYLSVALAGSHDRIGHTFVYTNVTDMALVIDASVPEVVPEEGSTYP